MISLLPPETKAEIKAARSNRLLLRYAILLLASFMLSLVAIGFAYLYLIDVKANAEITIENNKSKAGNYAVVQSQADSFKQNLARAKQILDNDVTYTNVILEIAQALPSGVVLDALSLDSQTFGTPTTFTANAKDYPTALLLKNTLQNSPLFSDVNIQSITGDKGGVYPLSVVLSVVIRKEAVR